MLQSRRRISGGYGQPRSDSEGADWYVLRNERRGLLRPLCVEPVHEAYSGLWEAMPEGVEVSFVGRGVSGEMAACREAQRGFPESRGGESPPEPLTTDGVRVKLGLLSMAGMLAAYGYYGAPALETAGLMVGGAALASLATRACGPGIIPVRVLQAARRLGQVVGENAAVALGIGLLCRALGAHGAEVGRGSLQAASDGGASFTCLLYTSDAADE